MASTHEAYVEHFRVRQGSDRAFGLTVGGILSAIAAYGAWRSGEVSGLGWLLLGLGVGLIVLALLAPSYLAPLNRGWTRLGLILVKIVNPIVLILIFAIGVVPMGLLMRLTGHDPMRRSRPAQAQSYWIERAPPGPAPASMTQQF